MRRDNTKKLNEVITKLMRNPKLEDRLEKLDILEIWEDVIGKNLKQYIQDSIVRKDILEVRLKSSTLRHELSYQKSDIIKKINKRLGKNRLKDIILK